MVFRTTDKRMKSQKRIEIKETITSHTSSDEGCRKKKKPKK